MRIRYKDENGIWQFGEAECLMDLIFSDNWTLDYWKEGNMLFKLVDKTTVIGVNVPDCIITRSTKDINVIGEEVRICTEEEFNEAFSKHMKFLTETIPI